MKCSVWFGLLSTLALGTVHAASLEVPMSIVSVDGPPQVIGTIKVDETAYGLIFTPNLKSLPSGVHGSHVHENASCAPGVKDGVKVAALAAGSHFDPQKTSKHLGPYSEGHLGDLPAIYVTHEGVASYPVLAPRLKTLSQVKGHALMIHVGADNHSDMPKPLGGGGDRIACGVI